MSYFKNVAATLLLVALAWTGAAQRGTSQTAAVYVALTIVLGLSLVLPAGAANFYHVTDLGDLPGGVADTSGHWHERQWPGRGLKLCGRRISRLSVDEYRRHEDLATC